LFFLICKLYVSLPLSASLMEFDAQRFAVGFDSQRFAVGILTVFSVSLVKIRISASLSNYQLESGF
jgi:hypothetical protein